MLQRVAKIEGCHLLALDGEIGRIDAVYFDDACWVVRYLRIDPGQWRIGGEVLISPHVVHLVDLPTRTVTVGLTRESAQLSRDSLVNGLNSRPLEAGYHPHSGDRSERPWMTDCPSGWTPPIVPPGLQQVPADLANQAQQLRLSAPGHAAEARLRSSSEVIGYRLQAIDKGSGHVVDFLVDDETWAIRYLVVDTWTWLPPRRVLVPSQSIREVNRTQRSVKVDQSRQQIRQAPEFDPNHLPPGDYARALQRK